MQPFGVTYLLITDFHVFWLRVVLVFPQWLSVKAVCHNMFRYLHQSSQEFHPLLCSLSFSLNLFVGDEDLLCHH